MRWFPDDKLTWFCIGMLVERGTGWAHELVKAAWETEEEMIDWAVWRDEGLRK